MSETLFEQVEAPPALGERQYKKRAGRLRQQLMEAQARLADVSVVVVLAGVDGAGKSETLNRLIGWMDPRWIDTRAYTAPTEGERERPEFWRYWRDLPEKGRIGIFLSAWYHTPLLRAVYGHESLEDLDARAARIRAFEQTLADDGTEILKVWLYLGREEQERRFRELSADPAQRWRVTQRDWNHLLLFDGFVSCSERLIRNTQLHDAPWTIVHASDPRARGLEVASALCDTLLRRLPVTSQVQVLDAPDVARPCLAPATRHAAPVESRPEKQEYRERLAALKARLHYAQRAAKQAGRSSVIVFEGWDAAGKGGVIRRLVTALDARDYRIVPVAAPTDEELRHHYLWRFWRQLPGAGRMTIFDRSWYGRVLVERVERFAPEEAWQRAFDEINDFERQLVENGTLLCKFWLDITKKEQKRRFEARHSSPQKRWKLSDEDWRNHERWDDYERALRDVFDRTSTAAAPWTLVDSQDKRFARVRVAEVLCAALERAVGIEGPPLTGALPALTADPAAGAAPGLLSDPCRTTSGS